MRVICRPIQRETLDRVNLQHSNWTGKAWRSAREAFGVGLEWPGYDNESKPTVSSVIGVLAGVGVLIAFAYFGPAFFSRPM